jgi:hypothetical protein
VKVFAGLVTAIDFASEAFAHGASAMVSLYMKRSSTNRTQATCCRSFSLWKVAHMRSGSSVEPVRRSAAFARSSRRLGLERVYILARGKFVHIAHGWRSMAADMPGWEEIEWGKDLGQRRRYFPMTRRIYNHRRLLLPFSSAT